MLERVQAYCIERSIGRKGWGMRLEWGEKHESRSCARVNEWNFHWESMCLDSNSFQNMRNQCSILVSHLSTSLCRGKQTKTPSSQAARRQQGPSDSSSFRKALLCRWTGIYGLKMPFILVDFSTVVFLLATRAWMPYPVVVTLRVINQKSKGMEFSIWLGATYWLASQLHK